MTRMVFSLFLFGFLMLATGPVMAADRYELDPAHAYVGFTIDHLGYSTVHGRFDQVKGEIMLDEANRAASSVSITVPSTSINTNHGKRDEHLRSPDFFNSLEFPEITFISTGVAPSGDNQATIKGKLTLLGVTKEIELKARLNKVAPHPFKKGLVVAGFSATGTIKRSDFGMKYGLPLVGDEVTLVLEAEGYKQ